MLMSLNVIFIILFFQPGYICSVCNTNVGLTTSAAKHHDCMEGHENIWIVDNYIYPYDPTSQSEEFHTELSDNSSESNLNVDNEGHSSATPQLWPLQAKKLLIELYPKYLKRFSDRVIISKEQMFVKLTAELNEYGCKYTAMQVKYRWRCFEKAYKNFTKHTKSTGRGYKKLEFYDELHDIFQKEPRFYPEVLTSSVATKTLQKENALPQNENVLPTSEAPLANTITTITQNPPQGFNVQKKGYKPTSIVLEGIHAEMKRKNDLTEQKLAIEKKKNELLERKLELMSKYLAEKEKSEI
uniref:Myb/SANT-like DNA-binding domain-containing protein n=1 Tax=Photinus pyralis TaxID=7054 RepID=A0A1Y1LEP1_PHOPY